MADERPLDIVLFGATGFTGGLTAEYLARARAGGHALGARRPQPRQARARARRGWPRSIPLRRARAARGRRRRRGVAARGRRVARASSSRPSGPTCEYGEPLVAACAAAGHRLRRPDRRARVRRPDVRAPPRATAVETGARLVHACGFDSIPHDLGALFTRRAAARGRAADGARASCAPAAALRRHVPLGDDAVLARAPGRSRRTSSAAGRAAADGGTVSRASRARRAASARLGGWALPLPTIDPQIVVRSAARARALRPGLLLRPLRRGQAAAGRARRRRRASGALFALAQIPPARKLAAGRMTLRATGPSPSSAPRRWFTRPLRRRGRRRAGRDARSRAATPATTRRRRCSPSRRSAWRYDDLPPTSPARSRPPPRWATR